MNTSLGPWLTGSHVWNTPHLCTPRVSITGGKGSIISWESLHNDAVQENKKNTGRNDSITLYRFSQWREWSSNDLVFFHLCPAACLVGSVDRRSGTRECWKERENISTGQFTDLWLITRTSQRGGSCISTTIYLIRMALKNDVWSLCTPNICQSAHVFSLDFLFYVYTKY